jgi:serine phosphatase RsbU (regulator of sigma subunit)
LTFHHIYRPTSSVGGDFFDVLKLSDHRAGIFIADVMGHGARSALVTAILRTLLQDLIERAGEPAAFLSLMNQHFCGIIDQSSQFLFVSAFYMVIDTERGLATFASAGHPPALLVNRESRQVNSLIPRLENNPALGLFTDSRYTSHTRFTKDGDLYLFFTDGVFEATNPAGEEFGQQRLRELVKLNLDKDIYAVTESIVEGVNRFRGDEPLADDICLVACEVKPGKVRSRVTVTAAAPVR